MYYTVNRWVYFEVESPFVLTSFKKGVGLFLKWAYFWLSLPYMFKGIIKLRKHAVQNLCTFCFAIHVSAVHMLHILT